MRDYVQEEKFLSALASSTRLEILDMISEGHTNPGDIAERLNKHRSSIEKRLRILVTAGIIEKEPSLNERGQLSMRYRISIDLSGLHSFVDAVMKNQNQKDNSTS
ncbi:MAG TPA: winged helix-turn-helix transcriptional regulator [Ferroplasma sp.]|nr:winged helix-turn-helix transcriptional regulator [Ferroplasma sp.]